MIILTQAEFAEAFQCAFIEYYDLDLLSDNEKDLKRLEMVELQVKLQDKVSMSCLKYPHVEWRLRK